MPISYKNKIYTTNGWLTSYKRKLYMGRNIEWNQWADFGTLYGQGEYLAGNHSFKSTDKIYTGHKYYLYAKTEVTDFYGGVNFYYQSADSAIELGNNVRYPFFTSPVDAIGGGFGKGYFWIYLYYTKSATDIMLFDLTQMFGAGNEPTTSEEFWSYFAHKYYPYNTGETQPLFKISRKSIYGSVAHKGDLINIEGKQYRVLKTNGNVAEVLAMYDAGESAYGNTQIYSGSTMDTYCNETFYGTLSTNVKNAIVDKKIQQDRWYSDGLGNPVYCGTYLSTNNYQIGLDTTNFGEKIVRKCYLLSIQDIIDYLNVEPSMNYSNTTLISENIWKMFWNKTVNPDDNVWYAFRTCYAADKLYNIFYVNSFYGRIENNNLGGVSTVRPAFQIDLSKIIWSLVEGG